jgi:hypothetical protein
MDVCNDNILQAVAVKDLWFPLASDGLLSGHGMGDYMGTRGSQIVFLSGDCGGSAAER